MPIPKDPVRREELSRERSERLKERFKNKENHPMFGKKHSEETRNRMSIQRRGKKMNLTEDQRRKMGEITRNRMAIFNHLKGTKQREETKLKRSKSIIEYYQKNPHPMDGRHLGYKRKSAKNRTSPMKGRHHSEFTRLMMSKTHIGKNTWSKGRLSPMKGIPLSEEHKDKLKIARRHRVFPRKDSKPERMMQIALALNGINFEKHKPIIGQPDIFLEPNICVFIDGDFWHANPNKYKPDDYIAHERFAKDIWAKDIRINNTLATMGNSVIRLWESDIKNNINDCAEKIINKLKNLNGGVIV